MTVRAPTNWGKRVYGDKREKLRGRKTWAGTQPVFRELSWHER